MVHILARGPTRFCGTCGSHLFWDVASSKNVSIFSGSLDGDTDLKIACHIYCADKGDYYEIEDGVPTYEGAFAQDT